MCNRRESVSTPLKIFLLKTSSNSAVRNFRGLILLPSVVIKESILCVAAYVNIIFHTPASWM